MMHHLLGLQVAQATWQTIYMVFISAFVALIIGLLLSVVLFLTGSKERARNNFPTLKYKHCNLVQSHE